MNTIERLTKKIVPKHIKPIANNCLEHLDMMEKLSREQIERDEMQNKQNRIKQIIGRSGISILHQNCSFDNYVVNNPSQRAALNQAKKFAKEFGSGFSSFIFSGGCGTGKNHLAVAICHFLIPKGHSVLCITIPDLMMRLRSIYSKKSDMSEERLLDLLSNVDLLILDEIGIQHRNSENTEIIINHIVDRRTSHKRPIGMLTNLGYDEMTKVLGIRVIDRMIMDSGLWVNFNWHSYRSKVRHKDGQ